MSFIFPQVPKRKNILLNTWQIQSPLGEASVYSHVKGTEKSGGRGENIIKRETMDAFYENPTALCA